MAVCSLEKLRQRQFTIQVAIQSLAIFRCVLHSFSDHLFRLAKLRLETGGSVGVDAVVGRVDSP